MLTGVDEHRRNRAGKKAYGFGTVSKAAANRARTAPAKSASGISALGHWVLDGDTSAVTTHGAQPGIDGYMAGCRCRRCCAAQKAREQQISLYFACRHHT
ncbi:Uncharacterised protein [Mycobacteroides abscessus subsp. massiliense]|nr:Uncharacterised protein [Mycobacteroides abscessus subsp. massiliense]SKH92640.1 Uncharacterised protein [Mycobacteroides abscessus subsp. massiliense]SKI13318.1 Uncharacterised protein [Mycobacteroides abscessus subsp. massiliense]SKK29869.1 Uncharacterised protein [Mycobacteroides abscessus subsp. massiliense]SKK36410.1 Uncharacterised protein [Mycobacteroides abscessus subsp. massiliense]